MENQVKYKYLNFDLSHREIIKSSPLIINWNIHLINDNIITLFVLINFLIFCKYISRIKNKSQISYTILILKQISFILKISRYLN